MEFPFPEDELVIAMRYATQERRWECYEVLKRESDRRGLELDRAIDVYLEDLSI